MPFEAELPDEVSVENPGHVTNQNQIVEAIKELRENTVDEDQLKAYIDERAGGPIPVASRAAPAFQTGNAISDGVIRGGTNVIRHKIIRNAGALRLVFTNHYPEVGAMETDGPNPITVRAAVEMTQGDARIPVTVNGAREFIVPPGGTLVSDPIGTSVLAGEFMWSWTYVTVAAGQKFPRGGFAAVNSSEGQNYGDPAGADVTLSGSRPTVRDTYGYGPSAILGSSPDSQQAVVAIIGDSISAGSADGQMGWVERSLQDKVAYQKVAYPSEGMNLWGTANESWRHRRLTLLSLTNVTDVIAAHGRNDTGQSLATLQQYAVRYWRRLRNYGRVWATTITPYTTSTDAWATVQNQTPQNAGHETTRVAYNSWLRDGAPINPTTFAAVAVGAAGIRIGAAEHPLSGVFDAADAAESARNSGKWKPGYVSDGIHPNPTGAAAISAVLAATIQSAITA